MNHPLAGVSAEQQNNGQQGRWPEHQRGGGARENYQCEPQNQA
jgi:hypothetical protein